MAWVWYFWVGTEDTTTAFKMDISDNFWLDFDPFKLHRFFSIAIHVREKHIKKSRRVWDSE